MALLPAKHGPPWRVSVYRAHGQLWEPYAHIPVQSWFMARLLRKLLSWFVPENYEVTTATIWTAMEPDPFAPLKPRRIESVRLENTADE